MIPYVLIAISTLCLFFRTLSSFLLSFVVHYLDFGRVELRILPSLDGLVDNIPMPQNCVVD